jgi:hypothetical protein
MFIAQNNQSHKKNLVSLGFNKAKNHLSLIVILLGAVCFLFTNILLREIFNENTYGVYSVIVSYLSVIYIYGLLGFEQVFMRFSHQLGRNIITTQRIQIIYLTIIILATTLISVVTYEVYFSHYLHINLILLTLGFLCMISSLILFNIFRLNENFVVSQIVSNGWKILMSLVAFGFFFSKSLDLELFVSIVLVLVITISLIAAFYISKNFKFVYNHDLNTKDTRVAFINFFIAITAFSIVLFADRFIIESKLGTAVFGDYFYLTTLVLSPYTILQNYVGFKQLVHFKQHFDIQTFIRFNKKIIVFSLAIGLLLGIMIFAITELNFLNFDFKKYTSTIGFILVLGIVRLYSSAILSAFEARTSINTLKTANSIVVLTTVIVSLFVVYASSTLNEIILGFIVIWTLRSLIYRQLLLSQIKKTL